MKLERLLLELNWTKATLAKAIRVQPGTIYRWKTDSDVPLVVIRFLEMQVELGRKNEKG